MKNNNIKYFLAANSTEGFVSLFGKAFSHENGYYTYIIKGGPGTGKSSFMKKLANSAIINGEKVIFCPCSSDPDSLDAVIFQSRKIVVLDGTAPHTLDPKYPAVFDEILNFGQFWNSKKILADKKHIVSLSNENKAFHQKASSFFKSACPLLKEQLSTALSVLEREKCESFAKKSALKHIPVKKAQPREENVFLGGLTPKGIVYYPETIENFERLIIINDRFGKASNIILENVRQTAIKNGFDVITVKNPLLPSSLLDAVIIPELSLCYAREYVYLSFSNKHKRIHAERFFNKNELQLQKAYLKQLQKEIDSLLKLGCEALGQAKNIHDKLEAYYIKNMDFKSLEGFLKDFSGKLL